MSTTVTSCPNCGQDLRESGIIEEGWYHHHLIHYEDYVPNDELRTVEVVEMWHPHPGRTKTVVKHQLCPRCGTKLDIEKLPVIL